MYFCIENYYERDSQIFGITTGIIYKPSNHKFEGFYISARMNARAITHHCKKRSHIESSQN